MGHGTDTLYMFTKHHLIDSNNHCFSRPYHFNKDFGTTPPGQPLLQWSLKATISLYYYSSMQSDGSSGRVPFALSGP